ncbi:MAG: helix-turn-helix transcriptional regulator [Xanthobacteraceae bacterium]
MLVRTPGDLGAVIRDRRRQLKFDQAAFAKRIGVSRYWVIMIERGHPRAALGLVLRAIDALNIQLDATIRATNRRRSSAVDIDAIVANAKKKKP